MLALVNTTQEKVQECVHVQQAERLSAERGRAGRASVETQNSRN